MGEHLKEELKEFNNEVDRMKFEKNNLEFSLFIMLLQAIFIFILIIKKYYFLITKLLEPFMRIGLTKNPLDFIFLKF
jgi:hypothetical protein